MPRAEDGTTPSREGFGPAGVAGSPFAVCIKDTSIKISGIELVVQVDDGGVHSFVLFGDVYDERRKRMPLVRLPGSEKEPSVAPLQVPFEAPLL